MFIECRNLRAAASRTSVAGIFALVPMLLAGCGLFEPEYPSLNAKVRPDLVEVEVFGPVGTVVEIEGVEREIETEEGEPRHSATTRFRFPTAKFGLGSHTVPATVRLEDGTTFDKDVSFSITAAPKAVFVHLGDCQQPDDTTDGPRVTLESPDRPILTRGGFVGCAVNSRGEFTIDLMAPPESTLVVDGETVHVGPHMRVTHTVSLPSLLRDVPLAHLFDEKRRHLPKLRVEVETQEGEKAEAEFALSWSNPAMVKRWFRSGGFAGVEAQRDAKTFVLVHWGGAIEVRGEPATLSQLDGIVKVKRVNRRENGTCGPYEIKGMYPQSFTHVSEDLELVLRDPGTGEVLAKTVLEARGRKRCPRRFWRDVFSPDPIYDRPSEKAVVSWVDSRRGDQ